jgi:hypothetical protein
VNTTIKQKVFSEYEKMVLGKVNDLTWQDISIIKEKPETKQEFTYPYESESTKQIRKGTIKDIICKIAGHTFRYRIIKYDDIFGDEEIEDIQVIDSITKQ